MTMRTPSPLAAIGRRLTIAAASLAPAVAAAQNGNGHTEALVRNALSAAPPSVATGATVVDHNHAVVRKGSNGWTCMPDDPGIPNNSPMCLDEPWLDFIGAMMAKRTPKVSRIGFGYMLQGDMPVSNIDPAATAATPTNQWLQVGVPHIMVIVPDTAAFATLTSDPHNGGPWIMWRGTPYAHIMIPTVPRER